MIHWRTYRKKGQTVLTTGETSASIFLPWEFWNSHNFSAPEQQLHKPTQHHRLGRNLGSFANQDRCQQRCFCMVLAWKKRRAPSSCWIPSEYAGPGGRGEVGQAICDVAPAQSCQRWDLSSILKASASYKGRGKRCQMLPSDVDVSRVCVWGQKSAQSRSVHSIQGACWASHDSPAAQQQ